MVNNFDGTALRGQLWQRRAHTQALVYHRLGFSLLLKNSTPDMVFCGGLSGSFRVEFEFASNPYFPDKVLWKEVLLESDDLPISTAVLSEAPPIKWRKEMNLTVRQVVKKAKVRCGT